jgi:UDP-GlcNAc3NAcA epimerase
MNSVTRVASVLGARPQFIKAAVVSQALRAVSGVQEVFVHTGQHYDDKMSRVFFEELELPEPDYHLGVGSGTHGAQTGRMLERVEEVLLRERPDCVLVYGDTNSTLAGALAAAKLHIPVAHVEAGLRSFNRRMPEEINRVLTDHASDLLFAPTDTAVANLQREGIPEERIHLVGDVMYDAALYYGRKAEQNSRILERLGLRPRGYVLATVHRAENTDDPRRLEAIIGGLVEVSGEVPVIFPVHPRTRRAIETNGLLSERKGNLRMIPPVGYLDMIVLERHARLIATDSGGVQKEAFFYRVPCVTLREETEWVELVELGWNYLVPLTDAGAVRDGIMARLDVRGEEAELYGDGRAALRVARIVAEVW